MQTQARAKIKFNNVIIAGKQLKHQLQLKENVGFEQNVSHV